MLNNVSALFKQLKCYRLNFTVFFLLYRYGGQSLDSKSEVERQIISDEMKENRPVNVALKIYRNYDGISRELSFCANIFR